MHPNQVKGRPVVPRAMPFDVVIRGGRVLDGTGAPWRRADIGTRGAKIARVGDIGSPPRRSRAIAKDRKSTRRNSSHANRSYTVHYLSKKTTPETAARSE